MLWLHSSLATIVSRLVNDVTHVVFVEALVNSREVDIIAVLRCAMVLAHLVIEGCGKIARHEVVHWKVVDRGGLSETVLGRGLPHPLVVVVGCLTFKLTIDTLVTNP